MIKRIYNENTYKHRHIEDVLILKRVLWQNGYEADLPDIAAIWSDYSDTMAAGWIHLPEDTDEIWDLIQSYVEDRAQY